MKNIAFILLSLIGLFGCFRLQTNHGDYKYKKLEGDWKTKYYEGDWKKTAFIFTFQDSTCSFLYPWGEFSRYWIDGDTLIIKEKENDFNKYFKNRKTIHKYLIYNITDDTLVLKPLTVQDIEYVNENIKQNIELIKLFKIKKCCDWKVERIGFNSTSCYGICPSMYLEVDSVGNMLFNGKLHTEKLGLYYGKLSKEEMKIIKSEIDNINLDSLKRSYAANWTDDQTCSIIIKTKNKTYESSAYGFKDEPVELRILFHRLMELYKNIELKENSDVINQFQLK